MVFVEITKLNTDEEPIENVEFAVFTQNGFQLRTGKTNSDGELELRGLPPGTFTLKETKAAEGYVQSEREYAILATPMSGGGTTVSIDGQTGEDSNKITVVNYKPGEEGVSGISIEKTADKNDNLSAGEVVTYTYRVENTGVLTLNNVRVTDEHKGHGELRKITPEA